MGMDLHTIVACPGGVEQAEDLRCWMNAALFPDATRLHDVIRRQRFYERYTGFGPFTPWEWEDEEERRVASPPVEEFEEHRSIWYFGQWAVQVCRQTLIFGGFRVSLFANADVRREWRRLIYPIAERLSSPFALYVPDCASPEAAFDYAAEGLTLEEVRERLSREVGPSGLTIEATGDEHYRETREMDLWDNYWYVDDFTSLEHQDV